MTIKELKSRIVEEISHNYNTELRHVEVDQLLLEYIGDREITNLFDGMHKWYA